MDKQKQSDKEAKRRTAENVAIGGGVTENVSRYGSAIKEHIAAYSGADNEAGTALKKSLSSIADSKLNPDFAEQNIRQQAGFSAEVKTVARDNAENIIGGKSTRVVRTDDMRPQTTGSGRQIGGVNDQFADIAEVNKDGFYIEGSARQLKYVGDSPRDCCQKLLSKDYDKYRQSNTPVEVPKDFYDGVQQELSQRIDKTTQQLKHAEQSGDTALAQRRRAELERLNQTKKNLRQGKLTNKEAIEARLNPAASTAKDIASLAHRSGLEGAATGAAIGGGISVIRNAVSLVKGEKEFGEAASDVVKDTAIAAGTGYVTSAAGSVIKGALQNSESAALRGLSKTAFPAQLGIGVLEVGKTFYRYLNGDIDGTHCLVELGEKGAGMTAVSAGAGIGQALIPIPIVGAMVGSMCGYTLSSIWYNTLVTALQGAKLARAERLQVEAECNAAVEALREYRAEMEKLIQNYFRQHMEAFQLAFSEMHEAFQTGDVDLMIGGANRITEDLGKKALFRNMDEFEEMMNSNEAIHL